jgi:hypothetical protein
VLDVRACQRRLHREAVVDVVQVIDGRVNHQPTKRVRQLVEAELLGLVE